MQAVILAAGKGTRMGELSSTLPKPLLNYRGKNLLHWKLDALPDCVEEVVLVIGYLGEKIIEEIGDSFGNKKITYIWDKELKGTAGSLWKAKNILNENFLVMMGDDLYSKEALENASREKWSITVREVDREDGASRIEVDQNGKLAGFVTAKRYREGHEDGGQAFVGLYSLSTEIFEYPLVKLKTKDEYGLPQTLLQAGLNIDLKILTTDYWKQITSPEDLV